ncbi:MAG: hypothetical protein U0795_16485 [Pirellulales bacterium]
MHVEAVPLAIALLPLAGYLLTFGWIHGRGRPVIVSGYRDRFVLGLALTGLAVVGPMQLFFPHTAAIRFQSWIWLLLLGLWFFCLILWSLSQRPRLAIYGGSRSAVEEAVRQAVFTFDSQAQWTGNVACLPGAGVEFVCDATTGADTVELDGTPGPQQLENWARFQRVLRRELQNVPPSRSRVTVHCLSIGMALVAIVAWHLVRTPGSIWAELTDLFRV